MNKIGGDRNGRTLLQTTNTEQLNHASAISVQSRGRRAQSDSGTEPVKSSALEQPPSQKPRIPEIAKVKPRPHKNLHKSGGNVATAINSNSPKPESPAPIPVKAHKKRRFFIWKFGRKPPNLPMPADSTEIRVKKWVRPKRISKFANPEKEPTSKCGEFMASCYEKFEEEFNMGPGFNNRLVCSTFAAKVLALIGLKMCFPTSWSIALTYFDQTGNRISEVVCENYWMIFIAMVAYGALYLHLRIVGFGQKYRNAICLFDLALFTICETCIVGVLTLYLPKYMMMLISVTMTMTCLTVAYYCWVAENFEVKNPSLYFQMLPLIPLFAGSFTISLNYVLGAHYSPVPVAPINLIAMLYNFFACTLCPFAMLWAVMFELQRLLAGRRVGLKQCDWVLASLILPLSFLYPSYLLRLGQTSVVFPAKVHPEPETATLMTGN